MKIKVVVDATPIISALIGGISRNIFFENKFNFISTEYTMKEVKKYLPLISEKSGIAEKEIHEALSLLPIKTYSRKNYSSQIIRADEIIGKMDKKDVDILALSFKENCPIWSEDKHFRDKEEITLLRTKNLI